MGSDQCTHEAKKVQSTALRLRVVGSGYKRLILRHDVLLDCHIDTKNVL